MTEDEQKQFDELKAQVATLTADNATLKTQRDTYKNGFESQSRMHAEAKERIKQLTAPEPT